MVLRFRCFFPGEGFRLFSSLLLLTVSFFLCLTFSFPYVSGLFPGGSSLLLASFLLQSLLFGFLFTFFCRDSLSFRSFGFLLFFNFTFIDDGFERVWRLCFGRYCFLFRCHFLLGSLTAFATGYFPFHQLLAFEQSGYGGVYSK